MTAVVLVVMLLLPGMSEPKVARFPMESFEACALRVAEAGAGLKTHEGEAYIYFAGCEVTGVKADPA